MVKKLSYICFSLLVFLDKIFKIITKRSILIWFNDFIQERSKKKNKILDKEIKFFVPNQLLEWRVDTYFSKEPETLDWIDSFQEKENLIFKVKDNTNYGSSLGEFFKKIDVGDYDIVIDTQKRFLMIYLFV